MSALPVKIRGFKIKEDDSCPTSVQKQKSQVDALIVRSNEVFRTFESNLDKQKDKIGRAERHLVCPLLLSHLSGHAERRDRSNRQTRQKERKDETGQAERGDRTCRRTRQDKQRDETGQAE